MQRRNFVLKVAAAVAAGSLVLSGCTMTPGSDNTASTDISKRRSIDANVDATLTRLFSTVAGSRELVAKARGVLVFPSVLQAGFIVGGQYGEGALRVGGSSVGYYSTVSGSFGLQAGAQSKAVIFLFMTQDALDKFRSSDGWSVGADASVALVKVGANGAVDTNTATSPVEVFVLTNAGLMGDVSLAGTKVTRLKI
ncbi:BPSL1445 family SYLF domain-containing lipoprotein [Paraburkholderia caballeronis]|uniref:Lipid-binding SYLF domain-containing protein n=1 Tax=Paraburkholderia caballeronis TaxID=416943 RepID=A0A1H7V953_9BURK|nr:YSC84-related protein [Paraburkholderia caballeronis]PXW16476.1 lipid-binding SYLF domain-containing protein [Paraburkholderia caballeronis]PXW94247.1 lipid-binding SYLF domain-containing protein [Paraburkholderia caballeronis]RAJ89726.1 lipid-binding SYLF domain-containing protein [Paraburkholderia caballeronis]TDV09207.1 lipid-binding SYLF domain-containing protein [Paraburkholderia caballeronis]TDV12267.1 lipid-binding SYLF domain-containing protein [Paraburkholderia caballeronis]